MVKTQSLEQRSPYNLLDSEAIANPYPIYHRLQSDAPLSWSESFFNGAWILTRYADVASAMRDPRLVNTMKEAMWIIGVEIPEHNKFRSLVHKAFTPRVLEGMRGHIQTVTDELIDAVQEVGRMEVIRDFAYPLPVLVIAEMLGVSRQDIDRFQKWSDDITLFLSAEKTSPEISDRVECSALEFIEYFRSLVKERREHPQDDLMTNLIQVQEQGDSLSEDEILGICVLLLYAGHETTKNLIGNGLFSLLRHPDQLQQLKNDPSLIGTAVEELLRYESPIQRSLRIVKEDLELYGQQIKKKQRLVLFWGAANHDPERFPDPERLDITRPDNPHLAFAGGSYFCLGAALARIEGQIAINTILRRLPNLQLETETVEWQENSLFRSLKSLPVVF